MQILVYHDLMNILERIKNLFEIKFIRFLFVGSANTAISFLTFSFFLLYWLSLYYCNFPQPNSRDFYKL